MIVEILKQKGLIMSKEIGERIKQIRIRTKCSQAKFAEKLSIQSSNAISLYEKGEREPKLEDLIEIAKIGNVTLDWLIKGEGSIYDTERNEELEEVLRKIIEVIDEYGKRKY